MDSLTRMKEHRDIRAFFITTSRYDKRESTERVKIGTSTLDYKYPNNK